MIISSIPYCKTFSAARENRNIDEYFIPDKIERILNLHYRATRLISEVWYTVSGWENANTRFGVFPSKTQVNKSFNKITLAIQLLKEAIDSLEKCAPKYKHKKAVMLRDLGIADYLEAKCYHFLRKENLAHQVYDEARQKYKEAISEFSAQANKFSKDKFEEAETIRYLNIVNDQEPGTTPQVLSSLKQLVYSLPDPIINNDSFKLTIRRLEQAFELGFSNLLAILAGVSHSKNKTKKNISANKKSGPANFTEKLSKNFKQLPEKVPLLKPFQKEFIRVPVVFLTALGTAHLAVNHLLRPLARITFLNIPGGPVLRALLPLFKETFTEDSLIDYFYLKGNIHHDLMKAYLKKDLSKAEYHKDQSEFYFNEYIAMLDSVEDSAEIERVQNYMNAI